MQTTVVAILSLLGPVCVVGLAPRPEIISAKTLPRRQCLFETAATTAALWLGATGLSSPARAADDDDAVLVSGVASLATGATAPDGDAAALYVTVKKGAAPQEFAGLVRGAPAPPIGAVRVPVADVAFPYAFAVRRRDLFPEFRDLDLTGLALTVSARLDADGVASTRGATDLVGSVFVEGLEQNTRLELKPRGAVTSFMAK